MSKKSKLDIKKIYNVFKNYLTAYKIQRLITTLSAIFIFAIILMNIDFANKKEALFPVPELSKGLIPVVYDENQKGWIKASDDNWYNYDKQKWANAVLVTDISREQYIDKLAGTPVYEDDIISYFVWIPRYRYQLFNVGSNKIDAKEIEIVFETKTDKKHNGNSNGEWLTHPAFTFGEEELNGFWVAKFETTGTEDLPTNKPNNTALRYLSINSMFNLTKKFKNYGLDDNDDSHVMKNIEWGAVAYLSQSKYGKYGNPVYTNEEGLEREVWINNSLTYVTGCAGDNFMDVKTSGCEHTYETINGLKASTTGNIYGIYDMVGGTWEYVMGNLQDKDGKFTYSESQFTSIPESKYYDSYAFGTGHIKQEDYERRILGDATGETHSWNNDYAFFIGENTPWFLRGGDNCDDYSSGMFMFLASVGNDVSGNATFRTVITK